jgi:hypothetical protein
VSRDACAKWTVGEFEDEPLGVEPKVIVYDGQEGGAEFEEEAVHVWKHALVEIVQKVGTHAVCQTSHKFSTAHHRFDLLALAPHGTCFDFSVVHGFARELLSLLGP